MISSFLSLSLRFGYRELEHVIDFTRDRAKFESLSQSRYSIIGTCRIFILNT